MRITTTFMVLLLCTTFATSAQAQSDDQDVTIVVPSINEFEIPDGDVTITITGVGSAGDEDATGTDNSTGYNITSNSDDMKITGELNALYPTGISLDVLLGTPTASGSGVSGTATQTTLSAAPQDLVTGMSHVYGTNVAIGYSATATAEADPTAGVLRTVTYTLTNM